MTSQKCTSCFVFNKNHNPYSSELLAVCNNLHTDGWHQSKQENTFVSTCICTCTCAQSCPILFNPLDCSLPGSSVHGIFQEYWIGLPLPTPGDLCCPGIEPTSLTSPVLTGRFFTSEPPGKFWWMTAKAHWLLV